MNIADLKNGETFTVCQVMIRGEVGKRLADMGFTRGVAGTVIRSALFGDPLQVNILNYNVSLRKSEARGVEVLSIDTQGTL